MTPPPTSPASRIGSGFAGFHKMVVKGIKMHKSLLIAALLVLLTAGCGSSAEVQFCEPEDSCYCTDGVERETLCVCEGGSDCLIDGDNIEFECEGNAACGLSCGENCLVTCPGTTSCTVEVGHGGVVNCPGTARCEIACYGDCQVYVDGAATAIVDCVNEADGAICEIID
jgi:hypothetical protein